MGEIADMMLDGTMDHETGEWNFDGEDGPGFPMTAAEAADFLGDDHKRREEPLFGVWYRIAAALDKAQDGLTVPEATAYVHGVRGLEGAFAGMADAGFIKADTEGRYWLTVDGWAVYEQGEAPKPRKTGGKPQSRSKRYGKGLR